MKWTLGSQASPETKQKTYDIYHIYIFIYMYVCSVSIFYVCLESVFNISKIKNFHGIWILAFSHGSPGLRRRLAAQDGRDVESKACKGRRCPA